MHISEQECLPDTPASMSAVVAHHLRRGEAISLWRLPNSKKKNCITAAHGAYVKVGTPVEQLKPGFILAPFDYKADFFFVEANTSHVFDADTAKEAEWPTTIPIPFHTLPSSGFDHPESENHYLQLVKKSIHYIAGGAFQKVVPSRRNTISLPSKKACDPLSLFNQLCTQYAHALVSLVSAPEVGTWIGASPELLVELNRNMQLRTTALAGTQEAKNTRDLTSVSWAQKEIEEHEMVSRYIAECLKKTKISEFRKEGPKTWQAGNVIHLKTDFTANARSVQHPRFLSKILTLLHPTPAVCGTPRQAAFNFLKTHEPFDRQFYGGYIGPINYLNESHIYVNLRCMQWSNDNAVLYAGAGVTRDSIPEKEWAETEMKMKTLLHVIKNREDVLL